MCQHIKVGLVLILGLAQADRHYVSISFSIATLGYYTQLVDFICEHFLQEVVVDFVVVPHSLGLELFWLKESHCCRFKIGHVRVHVRYLLKL